MRLIVTDRYDMAVTPPHLIANILDPRYKGSRLTEEETDSAFQYIYSYLQLSSKFIG